MAHSIPRACGALPRVRLSEKKGPAGTLNRQTWKNVQALKADRSRLSACLRQNCDIRLLSGCGLFALVSSLAAQANAARIGCCRRCARTGVVCAGSGKRRGERRSRLGSWRPGTQPLRGLSLRYSPSGVPGTPSPSLVASCRPPRLFRGRLRRILGVRRL